MKKLLILFIIIGLLMLMTGLANANNYYHNVQIQVEGEYKFKVNTSFPDANVTMDFEGIGKAAVHSDLRILTEDLEELQKWWSLF